MCRWCILPPEHDVEPLEGCQFMSASRSSRSIESEKRGSMIVASSCSSASESPSNDSEDSLRGSAQSSLLNSEKRGIVAPGMSRFEGIGKIPPPQPNIERLSPRVVNILGMNPSLYTLSGTNCYLVGTGKHRILIDAGESPAFAGQDQHDKFMSNVEQAMKQEGCTGLQMIIVTHLHADHWGGAQRLHERWGPTTVAMLPCEPWTLELYTMTQIREKGLLDALSAGPSPFKDGKFSWDAFTDMTELPAWPDEDLSWDMYGRSKLELQRDFCYSALGAGFYEAWSSDDDDSISGVKLQHGQVIETEGATLRVMHTPGHASNHVSLVLEEEHSLFSGDHVLGYGTTVFDDLYDYMASLEAMCRYKPVRLYPGHGPCIEEGTGLLERYIQHRQAREDQLVSLCATQTLTATQIANVLYANTPLDRMQYARGNVEKIVFKLWREGRMNCYLDASLSALATLPEMGYVYKLSKNLVWEMQDPGPSNRMEALIQFIARGSLDIPSKARL